MRPHEALPDDDARTRYRLADFDFALPAELIAQVPSAARAASRLLHVDGTTLADRRFAELPSLIDPGDVVVVNDTRVINARLFGRKPSGGRVEMLCERIVAADEAWVQIRASHMPKPGARIDLQGGAHAEVIARDDRLFHLRFCTAAPLLDWLQQNGDLPLPPYIARPASAADAERYQTVYATAPGAVAAPTAGLHFDPPLLEALAARGIEIARVTLHVGAGTFAPVTCDDLSQHRMHAEWYRIPAETAACIVAARSRGNRVIAIGTTSLRALESSATAERTVNAGERDTALFITPGFRFNVVDRLLTNFHLPRSTLLMLVSAFAGYDAIRAAYAHAIAHRYRFFSYGDAMLLERA